MEKGGVAGVNLFLDHVAPLKRARAFPGAVPVTGCWATRAW